MLSSLIKKSVIHSIKQTQFNFLFNAWIEKHMQFFLKKFHKYIVLFPNQMDFIVLLQIAYVRLFWMCIFKVLLNYWKGSIKLPVYRLRSIRPPVNRLSNLYIIHLGIVLQ